MKKIISAVIAMSIAAGMMSAGVFAKEIDAVPMPSVYDDDETSIKVIFVGNDGTKPYSIQVKANDPLNELPVPEFDGTRYFEGWCTDEECTEYYNIEDVVTEPFVLYAKWSDEFPLPFSDVKESDRFYSAISFAYENGLMFGIDETKFEPKAELTRAMLVAVLHRIENEPVVNYAMNFEDVPADEYYTEAVRWAASNGIVSGMSETEFAPSANIKREQLAAIIYRYLNFKCCDTDKLSEDTNTLSYDDIFDTSEYARPAMHFCLACDILFDREEGKVAPTNDATREEVAAALMGLYYLDYQPEEACDIYLPGEYQDKTSGRAVMDIAKNQDKFDITVEWGNSASECVKWTMTAEQAGNTLVYANGKKFNVAYDEKGEGKETLVYEEGEGSFNVVEGCLLWDGAYDEECRECMFEKQEPSVGISNPVVRTSMEEIKETLGFEFKLPENAENVRCFLVAETMAQVDFDADGVSYTARIKPAAEYEDISGMYYTWNVVDDCKVCEADGKVMRYIGDGETIDVCNWFEAAPGIMHSLSATAADLDGFDIEAIAEQIYVKVQDEN